MALLRRRVPAEVAHGKVHKLSFLRIFLPSVYVVVL